MSSNKYEGMTPQQILDLQNKESKMAGLSEAHINRILGAKIRSADPNWKKNVALGATKRERNNKFNRKHLNNTVCKTEQWQQAVKEGCEKRWHKEENLTSCPHCGEKVDNANYKRWHGDNCKLNPNGSRYKDPNKPKVRKKIENVTCPHCGKVGQKSIMTYHHFDNCKLNPANKQV